jgi:phenylpyruvate tautomerase PptA (4-oxalocrotonate tautomerase family)
MAFPTAVNDQITDAVTESNVKVLGDAPATALDELYLATAQALSNAAHNSTVAQQQGSVLAEAVTTLCAQALTRDNSAVATRGQS